METNMYKSAISLLLVLSAGCMGSVEEMDELGVEQSSLKIGPIVPICHAMLPPSAAMDDGLSYRFDATARCPAREFIATGVPSDQTVGVHVVIKPDESTNNDPLAKYPDHHTRTTYTISGKTSFWLPQGNLGGRWVERWAVLAQGTRTGNWISHSFGDDYEDIKVAVRSEEVHQACLPLFRPTPDGGWIPTGAFECTPERVMGRLSATLNFFYDYVDEQ